ncbi:sensor histidine kinase [Lactiplantibacillus paraxiangfangensis]|uniref:sensor histidine kinase n=1 Tax=Lactiplantibacillus paraxiangfangensis TaxID=3076224 RepID=UPI0030C74EA7
MHSIKNQVVGLFLVISVTLIGMIYAGMRLEMTRNVMPLNTSITQKMVDDRANQIDGWFSERLAELRLLANLPKQRHYTQQQLFKEVHAVTNFDHNNYVSIRLVTKDGISHSDQFPDFSVVHRNYYQEMQQHPERRYTVSNLLTSKEDHQSIVIIFYRLAKPLADHTAYIAAAVPLAKVEALAHNLSIYDGTGMLLGGDTDSPQINPQKELLLTTRLTMLPRWKINYIVQKRGLRESTQQLLRLLLFIAFVVISLLGLLLFMLLHQIVHPIIDLTQIMEEIQDGKRDARATINGPKEIKTLAETFNGMLVKVYENENKYREASIQVLQAQIQPHFLYNTLDTIQWQILGGDTDAAVDMVENLSQFFRKGLNHGQEVTTLRNELAHVQSYVKIQSVRFPQLEEVQYDVPEELMALPVLHFILQPIVENAINHGIRRSSSAHGKVRIAARLLTEQRLRISVANNGIPIAPEVLSELNSGTYQAGKNSYGIYNVRHRMKLFYSGQAQLQFSSTATQTVVQIEIPLLEGDASHATTIDC